ncbi:MAG TPA: HlyD family secretion protein [Tepidisphaeraceae bacterium]|jgi:membrane fusion protein (multidrug efflux system)|nr:HlyD family secretion protein [Tepidisphaeraceae bacterium]
MTEVSERTRAPAASNGDAVPEQPPEPPKRGGRVLLIFLIVVAVLAAAGGLYWLDARHFEETDDAFIDGHIVPISPQVSALVSAVHVDDNAQVHKGDLMVELDPTDYKVAVAQARGAEASARGKLEQARSGVPSARGAVLQAQAELDSAQVNLDNATRDLQRFNGLDPRARSQQQLDNTTATQKRAQADVEQAQAKLQTTKAQVATAEADVTAAEGDLQKAQADTHRAEVNLGYCRIIAPCDGKVTNKSVDAGMYVTPATQLFQLVPADVWVTANFKETQLDLMRPGQAVTIAVDAYPEREFHGTISSIQAGTGSRFSVIPAENATGNFVKVVQRVPVKITFNSDVNTDAGRLLSPGMSVQPKVRVR